MTDVVEGMRDALAAVGATGSVHVRDIDGDAEVGLDADEPFALASSFKVPILVTLCHRFADGSLDPTERVLVRAAERARGPSGLSVFSDDVELSLRDLAVSMMAVSDNAATDVILGRLGLDAVNDTMAALGLELTRLRQTCAEIYTAIESDFALDDIGALSDSPDMRERAAAAAALDPARTSASTCREMTALLSLIWTDGAGPPAACEEARRILGLQVFRDRLASGFADGVRVSGKTGTLPGIKNEVGVVEPPSGRRYAVAVTTKVPHLRYRDPDQDRVIGLLARLGVDALEAR